VASPETYAGIPREKIYWQPTIGPECRPAECAHECLAWCPQGVYELADDGHLVVAHPLACTVGDISCSMRCPFEAIHFPSQRALRESLRSLRRELDANKESYA